MDYTVLRDEILTDPRGYGYAGPWGVGSDALVAEMLNIQRPGVVIQRDYVNGSEILDAIQAADLSTLGQLQATFLNIVTSASGGVKVKSATVRAILANLFSGKTETLSGLLALQNRPGSRAEELFGGGTVITWDDVAQARRLA